jgi:hypothetical protein
MARSGGAVCSPKSSAVWGFQKQAGGGTPVAVPLGQKQAGGGTLVAVPHGRSRPLTAPRDAKLVPPAIPFGLV